MCTQVFQLKIRCLKRDEIRFKWNMNGAVVFGHLNIARTVQAVYHNMYPIAGRQNIFLYSHVSLHYTM